MPVTLAKPLFTSSEEDTTTQAGPRGSAGLPYIPGGFPRNGLPTPVGTALLCVMLFLASLYPVVGLTSLLGTSPLTPSFVEGVSFLWALWMLLHVRWTCRSSRGLFPVLAVFSLIVTVTLRTTIPTTVLLSLFFVISQGTMLMTVSGKNILVLLSLIPLTAAAISLLICQSSPLIAAIALFPWPTALVVSAALFRGNKTRSIRSTGLICLSTLTLCLTAVAAVALYLWSLHGTLSLTLLREDIESVRVYWVYVIAETVEWLIAQTTAAGAQYSETVLAQLTNRETIAAVVNSVINLLPGMIVATVNVLSFLALSCTNACLRSFGYGPYVCREISSAPLLSPMAAVTFFLAFFVTLFTADSSSLAGTVAQNILLILEPGMIFNGLAFLMARSLRRKRRSLFTLILLLAAAIFMTSLLFLILAVYGAGAILFSAITAVLQRHNSSNHNDPNGR